MLDNLLNDGRRELKLGFTEGKDTENIIGNDDVLKKTETKPHMIDIWKRQLTFLVNITRKEGFKELNPTEYLKIKINSA